MKIGPITLTRDSAWWAVSAVVSAAVFLSTFHAGGGADDPTALAYIGIPDLWLPYIRLIAFANVWISGKMSNSKLPDSGEVARGIRANGRPIVALLLAVALGAASGCAGFIKPNPTSVKHLVTVTVVSGNAVLGALQDGERALVCGTTNAPPAPACVAADRHQAISADFVTAFQLHRSAAQLVRDTPVGAPTSADLARLLGDVDALIDRILARVPTSTSKSQLIAKAQTIGGQR